MKATVKEKIWTYEDYIFGRIPPDVSEIINGKEVKKMPAGFFHGNIEGKIFVILYNYLRDRYWISLGEVALILSKEPLHLRGADIVVISKERLKDIPKGALNIPPELVIEIVSPGESVVYVLEKMEDYRRWGVNRQVWMFPEDGVVIVISSKGMELYSKDEDVELLEGVKLRLRDLLKEVDYESNG